MTRVTTRDVVLFAVLLALCTSVAAPASAVAIGDGDSETTLGDGLESDDSSSGELTDSSDDTDSDDTDSDDTDSDESTNESTDDGSTDDGSTNESTDESSSDTNDDSTSDSGHVSSWSSNESTADDSNSSRSGTSGRDGDAENRTLAASPAPVDATQDVSAGVLEALRYDLLRTLALEDGTDTVESTATDDDGSTSSDDTTDVDDETDTVSSSLDDRVDALVDGTSGIIVGLSASITGADGTPPRVDDDRSADTGSGTSTAAGTGATGAGADAPLPSDSATGVAVGVGAIAVAGVVRHGSVVPSGVAGLGSTLAAGLAPVVGRSSALDRLVRTLAPFRYSRYDDSDPLEHEARADVYEVVHGAPGAYLSKVADRADLPLSTARHHIRVLEREDLVSGAKVRGKRRFYPAYTSGIELAAALDDEATAAVIDAVARFGSASVSDLAEELDRDPSTVSHHLSRLAEDGIVVRERDGRAVNNRLSPEARTALEPERETDVAEVGEALASD